MSRVNPVGGSGKKQSRDSACTPEWLAKLIGRVQLDPCSNDCSHIGAEFRCILDWGGDGLDEGPPGSFWGAVPWPQDGTSLDEMTGVAGADWVTFVNPPYAAGQVIRWVRHYRHTRFIFLLRWDPSTKWFAELLPHCTHVWFPSKRINFEPPPGVTFSSNPFPHALYLRDPAPELLARLAPHGVFLVHGQRDGQQVVQGNTRGGRARRDRKSKPRGGGGGVPAGAGGNGHGTDDFDPNQPNYVQEEWPFGWGSG